MVGNARKSSSTFARAENPPVDFGPLRRVLFVAILIVIVVILWEGLKAFSASHDYALQVGAGTIDLTIFNDMQLPHLSDIARAFTEPAQRNGPPLYSTLIENASFTLQSAIGGFLIGGFFGFLLAVLFAHSRLMRGGCLPYVVASQTVPLIAIAPMIVIWFSRAGNSALSIPVIAAYLTFFPVTIYTLRGLTSVPTTALELMQSYAASQWEIFIKLRLPNALPQIFTALKISATASVVGAIIGELPSGFQSGLGVTILNFARYYNQSPPRLWATIAAAGLVGIMFFLVIVLTERLVVRWQREDSD